MIHPKSWTYCKGKCGLIWIKSEDRLNCILLINLNLHLSKALLEEMALKAELQATLIFVVLSSKGNLKNKVLSVRHKSDFDLFL